MDAHPTARSPRHLALDGLRGIAALGVAVLHVYTTQTFWLLWSMVDLFFVLSGYLIASILLDSRVDVGNFLVRRALRIWPVYYGAFVLAMVASYVRIHGNPGIAAPTGVLPSVFFVQFMDLYGVAQESAHEYTQRYIPNFLHSWTLAVEQQFYVLLALLVLLFRPSARLFIGVVCVALVCTVVVRATGQFQGVLASRADGLLLGCVLAGLLSAERGMPVLLRRHSRLVWPLFAALGAAVVAPYVVAGYGGQIPMTLPANPFTVLGYCLMFFALVGWVICEPGSVLSRVLSNTVLVYLGAISYAVYMFHPLIQGFVGMYDRSVPLADLPVAVQVAMWVLILGAAHLSKVLVEDRFNALKSRFPLYRERPLSVASPSTN